MPQTINYQRELDRYLERIAPGVCPTLLLHSCCAPCSSYVLEYLADRFRITLFYYNPNIAPRAEYEKRLAELYRLVREMGLASSVPILAPDYDSTPFDLAAAGYESQPEGGSRCTRCYRLRLEETAKAAKAGGFDLFSTTLTISPHKDALRLNQIGQELARQYGVSYLLSDFKKRGGYQRSIAQSGQYGLYRQNSCGCRFSLRDTNLG